jgi:carboxyl-terminal processing protease
MLKLKRPAVVLLVLAVFLSCWLAMGQADPADNSQTENDYRELRLFTDVLSIVRRSYVEDVSMKDLIYGAINGMLSSLDPHSSFLPPDMYQELEIDTTGEFGGLGIEITLRNNVLTVVSPIEDTPADRAGLEAGDMILKIEDRFTKDLSIMEAVKLMRGPAGSSVTITIMRDAFDKPREITLKREVIKVESIKARTLEPGIGYVRIVQFQERTDRDLRKALARLHKENSSGLSGLVLDLRNNPGGLLEQAVKVADQFLSSGLIVYTEGREEGSRMRFSASKEGTEPGYPLVVLINGGSASASEIVAGALHDNGRAVILGTQSFGKGSVQTIIPLSDDSGLRLTTALYYTPSGTSIQARGITPDIIVKPLEFKEVEDGGTFREKDLLNHFEGDGQSQISPKKKPEGESLETLPGESIEEDYQLLRAVDLLKGWRIMKNFKKEAA